MEGLYRGIVSNIKDPLEMGRIKVMLPEVLGTDCETEWCLPCVPFSRDNNGSFCIPQLKETVWIAFEDGDIDYPVYLGNWWSPNSTPLEKYESDVFTFKHGDCSVTFRGKRLEIKGDIDLENITVDGLTLKEYINLVVREVIEQNGE